jgi:hypothetical protein
MQTIVEGSSVNRQLAAKRVVACTHAEARGDGQRSSSTTDTVNRGDERGDRDRPQPPAVESARITFIRPAQRHDPERGA